MQSADKILPQKYYEREKFSSEEKRSILKKTGGVCCHCGKEIYIGYDMTIDHFIPLFKGGSNREINLIPLCESCNKEKDHKIYSIDYCKYLNEKSKSILSDYLTSYLQVTDYVQRHRLLAYDEYDLSVVVPTSTQRNKKHISYNGVRTKYKLKLATWDDFDKIRKYFIKYLRKYKLLVNEEFAKENVSFWMRFGCIYYIEKNDEITLMTAITIKHLSSIEDFRGINNQPYMYIFSYYNTELSLNILLASIHDIPHYIMEENNLPFTPINLLFPDKDNKKNVISLVYKYDAVSDATDMFNAFHVIVGMTDRQDNNTQSYEDMTDKEKKVYNFYKKFDSITDSLINYFKNNSKENVSWMMHCLFSTDIIKQIDGLASLLNDTDDEENTSED